MTQLFDLPARTAGAIVAVSDDHDVVHAARLVDIGRGELEPVHPVCDALIVPTRTSDEITCEICLIRLRPDSFTKAHRRARRVVAGWLRRPASAHPRS